MSISDTLNNILSPDGKISSKRLAGMILILSSVAMTFWLVATEGGTDTVNDLITTGYITGTALLGVSNITGIWKRKNNCAGK